MVRGGREALADLTRHLVHRPLALRQDIHDLGSPPVPERLRYRGESVEQGVLRRAITHTIKISFDIRNVNVERVGRLRIDDSYDGMG